MRYWTLSTAVAQSLSRVLLFMTPWTAARQATLSSTISQSLLRLMCIESVMLFNHLVLCLPPSPFALHLSQHQGLSLICWLFASGGQSIGASASTSVLPMSIQDWFPLGWTALLSLQSKGLSRDFPNNKVWSINSSVFSLLYGPTLTSTHDYWKNHQCMFNHFSHIRLFVTPWTVACQGPLSLGFSRQKY